MSEDGNLCRNSNVSVSREGDTYVMRVTGDFTGTTTPLIHECCKKVRKADDVRKIVLDFAAAGRVDTTAFACIINFIKEHIGSSVEINVANLRKPEEDLLKLLRIEKMIKVVK